ncbi:MAG TPA: hypothetical protein VHE37_00615, partial [Nevskiaceae bacterium]|nr:hypothetical protein [Nevskiaceae bacterium]
MPRDYAQSTGSPRHTAPRKSKGKGAGLPSWVWLFAGLSVGLAVAAFVYMSRPVAPMPASAGAETSEAMPAKPAVKAGKP